MSTTTRFTEEAASKILSFAELVEIVREFKPSIQVTYRANGNRRYSTFLSKKLFLEVEETLQCVPQDFGSVPTIVKNRSQVSIFQGTVHEPPLPEDCHSLQHFEQSCVEWHKQQPKLSSEKPFVMPDEVPISKRFSGCRFEVRIFASSRFHGKSQAWIVDTQTQQPVEGYDNLGDFQDFAECYEKCQHLTTVSDRLAFEASALESSYQEWKLITVANKPISVPYG